MRVGIIQPNFIPWRGYFDFIRSVDLFIVLDDVQFTRWDWRSRNRIKTPQGTHWLTVPVAETGLDTLIRDARINNRQDWQRRHRGSWQANYGSARHFDRLRPVLDELYGRPWETLLELNIHMIRVLCTLLDIRTPIELSSRYQVPGTRTEKLIGLLRASGATRYLSGPSADAYLEKTRFAEAGIALEYKTYDYGPYPQRWGPFDGAVSVLDLIANCGDDAANHMRSHTPDRMMSACEPSRVPA